MKKIDTIIAATLATLMLTTTSPALASSSKHIHKPTKAEIAEFNELWKDDAYKTHKKSSKKKSSKKSSKKTSKKTSKSKDEVYSCNDDQYKIEWNRKKRRATIYFMPFDKWVKIGSTAKMEVK